VEASERVAIERGALRMTLHARQTAVPFYERLGYRVVGEPFIEVGIPHRAMEKSLPACCPSDTPQ
jgi:predicted GNAT family N-acyltransferase